MTTSRRTILKSGLAALGGSAGGALGAWRIAGPLATGLGAAGLGVSTALRAQNTGGDSYATANGELSIHPVSHASFVINTPDTVIYADPVGGADTYAGLPPAQLIMITHEHGDHFDPETLSSLLGDETRLVVNPNVLEKLSGELKERASAIGNGDDAEVMGIAISAIPAYNLTDDRLQYHPPGRDNGYILTIDGSRIYIAGDTEAIPEMRSLSDIDIAFVPMNLPYTMDVDQAASGVLEFAPGVVYPYHHKGSDIGEFARLVEAGSDAIRVVQARWYG